MFPLKWVAPLALALALTGLAAAAPVPVRPTNTWKGSVDDEKLRKEAPEGGVIVDAKTFEKVVKAWKVAAKAGSVDFDKELVLFATTPGSRLNLSATLDEKGNLRPLGFGTADFGPGFRYVLISVPKKGVKTVDGKPFR
jgi:hypothetical protein